MNRSNVALVATMGIFIMLTPTIAQRSETLENQDYETSQGESIIIPPVRVIDGGYQVTADQRTNDEAIASNSPNKVAEPAAQSTSADAPKGGLLQFLFSVFRRKPAEPTQEQVAESRDVEATVEPSQADSEKKPSFFGSVLSWFRSDSPRLEPPVSTATTYDFNRVGGAEQTSTQVVGGTRIANATSFFVHDYAQDPSNAYMTHEEAMTKIRGRQEVSEQSTAQQEVVALTAEIPLGATSQGSTVELQELGFPEEPPLATAIAQINAEAVVETGREISVLTQALILLNTGQYPEVIALSSDAKVPVESMAALQTIREMALDGMDWKVNELIIASEYQQAVRYVVLNRAVLRNPQALGHAIEASVRRLPPTTRSQVLNDVLKRADYRYFTGDLEECLALVLYARYLSPFDEAVIAYDQELERRGYRLG